MKKLAMCSNHHYDSRSKAILDAEYRDFYSIYGNMASWYHQAGFADCGTMMAKVEDERRLKGFALLSKCKLLSENLFVIIQNKGHRTDKPYTPTSSAALGPQPDPAVPADFDLAKDAAEPEGESLTGSTEGEAAVRTEAPSPTTTEEISEKEKHIIAAGPPKRPSLLPRPVFTQPPRSPTVEFDPAEGHP